MTRNKNITSVTVTASQPQTHNQQETKAVKTQTGLLCVLLVQHLSVQNNEVKQAPFRG